MQAHQPTGVRRILSIACRDKIPYFRKGLLPGNIRNFNKMVDVFDPRKDIVPLK